ncbi:SpoIIE family protein phosphatase [Leptospira kirschneri]|uniref:Stage II sporulation protein E n=2 Tax=Leptospira kirschneri TaxID=29507 RepID=A0A828XYX1_9LEPT|nr:SpoIIE family protein phosphatase [Leptospira kirschneri]EMO75182.1 stage II sporulation protein E [Leptospira kirschneri str. 200801925]EKO50406.1 stage II sporulation protein E [Leptospira kirschneri str. 200802841]EMJ94718.1 stage II sporulation protein E [Leptospira kirschneri str. JB]EMO79512.1 stage II sporulation protein E [Leptospira kirschneri str. 200801774]EPG49243.1 SpoIIE-like protein phosphatase domain protein [Leptospira kirschneri serovar Cynopteri str. 3522 CT]
MINDVIKFDRKLFYNKFVWIFIFFISTPVFAFPIDLTKDWKLVSGKNLNVSIEDVSWKEIRSLPIPEDSISFSEDIYTLTLLKTFEVSVNDFQKLNLDGLSIHFPFLTNVYEVYFNGEKIGSGGIVLNGKIIKNGFKRHVILPIPENKVQIGKNEIRLILSSNAGEGLNVYASFDSAPLVVDLQSRNVLILSERSRWMLAFLYLFVGFYHFLLYFKRPQEKYNLFFGLFSTFFSVYIYLRSNVVYELDLDPLLQMKLEYMVIFNITSLFLLFLDAFFRRKVSFVSKLYQTFTLALTLLIPFSNKSVCLFILQIWQFSIFIFIIYSFFIMYKTLVQKDPDAIRMVFGFLVLMISGVADLVGSMGLINDLENYGILKYGFFVFEVGMVFILANRFLRAHKEAEELNLDLDRKVKERTRQLENTLDQVRELKIQQDGDYFLTSLILDPLNRNQVENDFIIMEGLSRQKKRFQFKQWKKEIGGDIIIADEICLKNREYLVFVNGDAMGKSIQGASGALVLGVVFRSFIARTKTVSSYHSKPPELWLKECFLELQNIFESFDGSMLASVVLGLVDLESGILFFLNAEHPPTVLYRNGVATFIESKLELRKIGITGLESKMKVKTFLLEKGDTIIVGSDGRDDIFLGVDQDGTPLINEDECQFLRRVEESGGDLELLVQGLESYGELTDDLSIVKLTYLKDPVRLESVANLASFPFPDEIYLKCLQDENWENTIYHLENLKSKMSEEFLPPVFKKELAKVYYKVGKYEEALFLFEELISEFPEDIEVIFNASLIYKKLKRYYESIELGERVLLREPDFLNNIVNLAESYILIYERKMALVLLEKIESLDSEHLYSQKIRIQLEQLELYKNP